MSNMLEKCLQKGCCQDGRNDNAELCALSTHKTGLKCNIKAISRYFHAKMWHDGMEVVGEKICVQSETIGKYVKLFWPVEVKITQMSRCGRS